MKSRGFAEKQCSATGTQQSNSVTDRNYCTESLPTNDFTSDPVLPNVHMQQMLGGTVDPHYSVSPTTYDHLAVPYGSQYTDPLMMSSCMQINTDNVSNYTFCRIFIVICACEIESFICSCAYVSVFYFRIFSVNYACCVYFMFLDLVMHFQWFSF